MPSHLFQTIRADAHHQVEVSPDVGMLEVTSWEDSALDYHCVRLTAPAALYADVVVKLCTWPEVVALAAERMAAQLDGIPPVVDNREITEVAKAYFRKGFAMFSPIAADFAIRAARNA